MQDQRQARALQFLDASRITMPYREAAIVGMRAVLHVLLPAILSLALGLVVFCSFARVDEPVGPLGRKVRLDAQCDDFEREDWAFDLAANRDTQEYWTGSCRGTPRRLERVAP